MAFISCAQACLRSRLAAAYKMFAIMSIECNLHVCCLWLQVWKSGWQRYLRTYVVGIHRLFLRQKQIPKHDHDFTYIPSLFEKEA